VGRWVGGLVGELVGALLGPGILNSIGKVTTK
jgi:hypothetical protein